MVDIQKLKSIDIKEFLEEKYGYEFLKHGTNRYKLKEHDSLIVRNNKFYWNSKSVGGDIFTLLKELRGLSFKEAVNELVDFSKDYKFNDNNNEFRYEKIEKKVNIEEYNQNKALIKYYLHNKRKLDINIVEGLIKTNTVYTDKNNNICFSIRNKENEIVGFEKVGSGYRRFKQNTSINSGFNIRKGDGKNTLYIFESAIDMLSFLEISKDFIPEEKATFVSISGLREDILDKYIYDKSRVYACLDNDEAGENFYKKIKKKYVNKEIIRQKSVAKDFNEDIKNLKGRDNLKIAVKVGNVFTIAEENAFKWINIVKLGDEVEVDGKVYELYKGETYEESKKIDSLLDTGRYKEYVIDNHIIKADKCFYKESNEEKER